jgi:hypothetical protein
MLDLQILDWLDENRLRWYPLKQTSDNAVCIIPTLGTDTSLVIRPTGQAYFHDFQTLLTVGDEVGFLSSTPRYVVTAIDLVSQQFTVSPAPATTLSGLNFKIVKTQGLLSGIDSDSDGASDLSNASLQAIILDANLVFDAKLTGDIQLYAITVGTDAVITIAHSNVVLQTFTVPDYATAAYPFYCRNTAGSLLVFGEALKLVQRNLVFENMFFEDSVCHYFYGKWAGVTSLGFNGETKTGDIDFTDGYQFKTEVRESSNAVFLGARSNYGDPLPCGSFFTDIATVPCDVLISSINGIRPSTNFGDFKLTAGDNVSIFPDKEHNRIFLGLSFKSVDICKPRASLPNPNIT